MVRVMGVDHLVIRVSDYEKSKAFYGRLFTFLGFEVSKEHDDSIGWTNGKTRFWIGPAHAEGRKHKHRAGNVGFHHYAFQLRSRKDVDALQAPSGLVKASKTRLRGASKTRVRTTSRSVGIVILSVPAFCIGDLLYRSAARPRRADFPCRTPPSHAHGKAVTTSAIGYQSGPRSIGIVAIAPARLSTNPATPKAKAWRIGLRGANLAAM